MAIGYLQIQTRTAQGIIPLEGVRVTVLDDEGNTLYRLITDQSGETRAVPLQTMDRSFSQNPDYLGIPYIGYGVIVEGEGFESVSFTEIPIFDGETATLPVMLTPLQSGQSSQPRGAIENTAFGPPAVTMDEPRNQEGTSADSRVLRQVVIPNPITVHLGAPGSSASNVTVSFSDYVKNVASCEIYPTWPASALRANIYAIMTFALNRVYTEW